MSSKPSAAEVQELAVHGAIARLAVVRAEADRLEAFLRACGRPVPRHSVNGRPRDPAAAARAQAAPTGRPGPKPYALTIEQRAAMSRRMRKLWREKRDVMLKGARRGAARGVRTIKAKAKRRKRPEAPAATEAPAKG